MADFKLTIDKRWNYLLCPGQLEDGIDHFFSALIDDPGTDIIHIAWSGDQTVDIVDANIGFAGVLVLTLHGIDGVGRSLVRSDGQPGVETGRAEHAGGQYGGDAGEADRFFGFDHFAEQALDLFVDFAGRAIDGERGKIFYGTVTAGEDQGIQL